MGRMKDLDILAQDTQDMLEKIEKYHKGEYEMEPPPVATIYWSTYDWVRFIDKYGVWHE